MTEPALTWREPGVYSAPGLEVGRMRYALGIIAVGVGLAAFSTGCGPNCQSSCNTVFNENECNLQLPGQTQQELIQDCVRECEAALRQAGSLDGYDPDKPNSSGESVVLNNETQAAVWMDCVETTACEDLEKGYCAGGGI